MLIFIRKDVYFIISCSNIFWHIARDLLKIEQIRFSNMTHHSSLSFLHSFIFYEEKNVYVLSYQKKHKFTQLCCEMFNSITSISFQNSTSLHSCSSFPLFSFPSFQTIFLFIFGIHKKALELLDLSYLLLWDFIRG